MAGAGYKLFQTGDVLTAAQVNTYLNEQTVMVFASAAARTSALTSVLAEGMVSYLQDTNAVEVYNGSAWVGVSGAGDVTEVQAGTGISVASGTGPIPVVTNTMATAVDAKGDLIVGTGADTFARLAVGANDTILVAASGEATGLKWAAPSSTPTFVGCVLTKSVGQTINNASITDVTWDVEELDTNSFHSAVTNTDRVTIPSGYAGKYLVTAQLQYGNFSGGSNRLAIIYKNTTQIAYANVNVTRGTPFASYTCSMTVGDYFKVAAYQDSGTSNTLEGNNFTQGATIFQVIYLGV